MYYDIVIDILSRTGLGTWVLVRIGVPHPLKKQFMGGGIFPLMVWRPHLSRP